MNNIKIKNNKIWDIIRKKWIAFTPEEQVRQQVIHFLIHKKYPPALISVEKEITFNTLKKRFDILVYTPNFDPYILIECKNENIKLDTRIREQITAYNLVLKPHFIVITNGTEMKIFERKNKTQCVEIKELPNCIF